MTDSNFLKSKMIAIGDENFVAVLAEVLNCSRSTASKKLNGKASFSQDEIIILSNRYGLSGDEIKRIFVEGEI